MMQLIIGATIGFIIGQGVLFGIGRLTGWIWRGDVRDQLGKLAPAGGPALIAGFIKYAGALGACVALVTLGVWAVEDYVGARAARNGARAELAALSRQAAVTGVHDSAAAVATLPPSSESDSAAAIPVADNDPYNDAEFKVHRKPHRAGSALSLKETLVQRSEAKARADLLREIQQKVNRSQYDCEAAERADKYLKADLDVWGFAAWQVKYFPADNYKGATLPQCQEIKTVVDHSVGFVDNRRH